MMNGADNASLKGGAIDDAGLEPRSRDAGRVPASMEEALGEQSVLACSVYDADAVLFQGSAVFVEAPGETGLRTILPGHAPFVQVLTPGVLTVCCAADTMIDRLSIEIGRACARTESFEIHGGLLVVDGNHVHIFAPHAARFEDTGGL